MRYCSYCKRLNTEHPQFCRYCGRTWNTRLCPRGHPNPADANFCGECGNTDLTEMTGSFPLWLRAVAWLSAGFTLFLTVTTIARSAAAAEVFRAAVVVLVIATVTAAFLPKATTASLARALVWCLKLIGQLIRFFLFGNNKSRGKRG